MEPFYSRKDDVPERPREFAGTVFRIPHKDSLKVLRRLASWRLFFTRMGRVQGNWLHWASF